MKQGRKGCGRSNASRGRENLKALHSRVRQARCRSLPASESVVGHQTPRKGRPRPHTASGRTWVFGHDNLRRTMSTWEWQRLPCPANSSARTEAGGSGPLDSSSGSRCSRRSEADELGHQSRSSRCHPHHAQRGEASPCWRGNTAALELGPCTARYRPTRSIGRSLRSEGCLIGGSGSGLVRLRRRQSGERRRRDSMWPLQLRRAPARLRYATLGSCRSSNHAERRAARLLLGETQGTGRHRSRARQQCLH
jgi:hypothetical protein